MSSMAEVMIPVEELQQKTIIIEEETSEIGGGNDQVANADKEGECEEPTDLSGSGRLCLQLIGPRAMEQRTRGQSQDGKPPKIHKIPQKLRDEKAFKGFYEPRTVSIGPYYCGKLGNDMEAVKDKAKDVFLEKFVGNSDDSVHHLNKFAKNIKQSSIYKMEEGRIQSEWYDMEDFNRNVDEKNIEDEFIRIMFRDGCFIIIFIYYYGMVDIILDMTEETTILVRQDLFMLENQLPFPVILALCTQQLTEAKILSELDLFIQRTLRYDRYSGIQINHGDAPPLHLLDLLQSKWVGENKIRFRSPNPDEITDRVPNVKELTAAGISLRPNSSNRLGDINFSCHLFGTMTIPKIIFDDLTKTILLNAIALEECREDEFGFSSCLSLLNSLIDDVDDVKTMKTSGVLQNLQAKNKDVADFFNKISLIVKYGDSDDYSSMKEKLGEYLGSKRKKVATSLTEVKREHFRNPWTTIAVLAAGIAILLTAVQTYLTIFPRSAQCSSPCNG